MLTILIPVLKTGYLESQLTWLDRQTHRDFTVVVMDVNHHVNKQQPWAKKTRTYQFHHVPLVHNVDFPKRQDFSIKNNLALLAPTDRFLFLSDTHYPTPDFVAAIAEGFTRNCLTPVFEAPTVLSTGYDPFRHTVDIGGVTTHLSRPVFVFDRRTFFYVLNGFDETYTYAADYELLAYRMLHVGQQFTHNTSLLYHIHHAPEANGFGRRWRRPCEKCDGLFARWKFDRAYDTGEFPAESCDPDLLRQQVSRDPDLGIAIFQCPNCGFGGALNPTEYEKVIRHRRLTGAPTSGFDGRTGRNLVKVYETMTKQVNNNIEAKLAYLMTTY